MGGVLYLRTAFGALALSVITVGSVQAQAGGDVPPACTLDSVWVVESATAGALPGQTSGTTWTLPQSLVLNAVGVARSTGTAPAVRFRTQGDCNTSHTIRVSSLKGGLRRDAGPVDGFLSIRSMQYTAQWHQSQNGSTGGSNMGPIARINTTGVPGEAVSVPYVVAGSLPAPGDRRRFDVRLQINNAADNQPMAAGAYSDTVTVTLSVN